MADVGLQPDPEAIDAAASITENAGINNTADYIDPHDPSFRAGVLDVLYLNNFYVGMSFSQILKIATILI